MKRRVLGSLQAVAVSLGLIACNRADEAKSQTGFEERYPHLPKEALERRQRSMDILAGENVPLNEWLPVIETTEQLELPTQEQVLDRALALIVLAAKGEGVEEGTIAMLVRDYGLQDAFSPREQQLMALDEITLQQAAEMTWRYEAAHTLFWALGFVEELEGPRSQCDVKALIELINEYDRKAFSEKAALRSEAEILDQVDLIYRYRWALVEARINGEEPPAGLDPDVAMERHQALNWLMYHAETGWDDVPLDT